MGRGAKRGTRSPEGEEDESRQQAKDKGRLLNVASHQVRISMRDIQTKRDKLSKLAEECDHSLWKGLVLLPFCLVFGSLT